MFYKLQKAVLNVKDGIIDCHFYKYTTIEVEDIKDLLTRVEKINTANAFRHALLLDLSEMIFLDQKSRHYLDEYSENLVIALAFYAVSNQQNQMIDLFMNFKKSKISTKKFENKDFAKEWLSTKLNHLVI